jgi:2-(1,2-epoxy-1,2-dihydrophenyl)acetyl-CoA isomerase
MEFETIQLEINDQQVAVLTLNRPDALNALGMPLIKEFPQALDAAQSGGARALIVTGSGRAFCAGGDLREMQEIAKREGRIEAFFEEPLLLLHDCIKSLRRLPLPVIAAVNGLAVGAGTNFALACDIVIAAESASFNEGFIKIGLTPDCGGTFILPRLVGPKIAAELLMTGDMFTAQQAAAWGMINRVVPDAELMATAMTLATRLAKMPTAAIGRIKDLLELSATNDYGAQLNAEHQAQLTSGQSPDFREGVAAFFEKRPPVFTGS